VLVEVRDPGNAGTVLRAADAFAADAVVTTHGSVDPQSPKAARAAAGSLFHLPVVAGVAWPALRTALRERGLRLVGADPHAATTVDRAPLSEPVALVLGNEAHGLPAQVAADLDLIVRIPLAGRAESLNLAAAAAVLLYEASRRHLLRGPSLADDGVYLELLPDAVVVVDAEGRVAYANPAAERLARAGRDELVGRPMDDAVPLRDGAGNPWWTCSERLRRLPGVRRVPVRELHLVGVGEPTPVDLTASFRARRRRPGRPDGVRAAGRLDPEPGRQPARRAHLHPRPRAALAPDQRQGLHLDPAAPLGALHRRPEAGDAGHRQHGRRPGDPAHQGAAGRLPHRRRPPGAAPQGVRPGRHGRGHRRPLRLQHDRHRFQLTFPDGFPRVYADPDKIEQVLTNLVENAVKYSDGGR
jgi:tRNA(Leu) C34 or U34 (ribose-2'-O)-methylase TrmL